MANPNDTKNQGGGRANAGADASDEGSIERSAATVAGSKQPVEEQQDASPRMADGSEVPPELSQKPLAPAERAAVREKLRAEAKPTTGEGPVARAATPPAVPSGVEAMFAEMRDLLKRQSDRQREQDEEIARLRARVEAPVMFSTTPKKPAPKDGMWRLRHALPTGSFRLCGRGAGGKDIIFGADGGEGAQTLDVPEDAAQYLLTLKVTSYDGENNNATTIPRFERVYDY